MKHVIKKAWVRILMLCLLVSPMHIFTNTPTKYSEKEDVASTSIAGVDEVGAEEQENAQAHKFTANCLITPGKLTVGGPVTFTSFGAGVVQSNSSGVLSSTNNGTDGQLLIGATGAAPAWANLTSSDHTIQITNGPNSIDLVAIGGGGGGIVFLDADNGQHAGTAVVTVTGGGAGSNITTFGNNIDTLTIKVTGTTPNAVQVGSATGSLSSVPAAATGTLLQSNGANAPTWSTSEYPTAGNSTGDIIYGSNTDQLSFLPIDGTPTRYLANTGAGGTEPAWSQVNLTNGVTGTLPVANGGTNATSFTNSNGTVYFDGTKLTTTTLGTAMQVLTSNGAGLPPSYQDVSAVTTINAGTNISVTGAPPSVTVSVVNNPTFSGLVTANAGLTVAGTTQLTGLTDINISGTSSTTIGNPTSTTTIAGPTTLSNFTKGVLSTDNAGVVSATNPTNHAVQVGTNTGTINSLSPGNSGQLLQSGGGTADPAWTTSTYPTTNAQGDIIIGSAANTFTTLSIDTTPTRYLANTGAGNTPQWDQVDLTNGATGVLPIANGGTNTNSFTSFGAVYFDGTNNKLAATTAGTSGYVLTSNGSAAPSYQPVSGSGAVTSVNAGTNINITGTATAPIVNVVNNPTFSGLVTAQAGATITGTTNINTSGSSATTIGNGSSTTSVNGGLNVSGGETITSGTLTIPAGNATTPSLTFAGSPTTGFSGGSNTLSFSTTGFERMNINSSGIITVDQFITPGVIHNNSAGQLNSSLVVGSDIANLTIPDSKLLPISTAGKVLNSATTATSTNTPNAIVARDGAGNFSAGTITANLTGAASLNVLKAGDTMTGNLTMATQNAVRFQDNSASLNFVGLNAPVSVANSYTLSLPSTAPTAHQVMQANSITPTNLEWFTPASNILPATSRTIYVTTYGSDITGDGSLSNPYASFSKAVNLANTISSSSTPVVISISPGNYFEDNSSGPITISAAGVSVLGETSSSTTLFPNTLSQDFITTTAGVQFNNITLSTTGSSTATGINTAGVGNNTSFNNVSILLFNTGVSIGGTAGEISFTNSSLVLNGTGLIINNAIVLLYNCNIIGTEDPTVPANTGISATGSNSLIFISGGLCASCDTGITLNNNANVTVQSTIFRFNANSIIQTTSSILTLQSCTFIPSATASTVTEMDISGAGTQATLSSCIFNSDNAAVGTTTAIKVTNQADVFISDGQIDTYTNALIIGNPGDTASTKLKASGVFLVNCTNDIIQKGSATFSFVAGTFNDNKITINDPTNVTTTYFDAAENNILNIGSFSNIDTSLVQVENGSSFEPTLSYKASLYDTQAIGYNNPSTTPASWFALSNNAANLTGITTDRTQSAAVRLVSDTGSGGVGTTVAIRGWDIIKNGDTNAELAFSFQNTDTFNLPTIPAYTVLQLDGINNQVQLPTAGTKIVFDGDTNLYRSNTNLLKTDGNLIVGGLTANRAVATDNNSQLVSSVTTATELSFLNGVTSNVQTQLDGKVSKSGDTMTGTLQLPAGTTSNPSLTFTGSTTTGLSANSSNLSFSTSGQERMKINSAGTVSINAFVGPAGVVHDDINGNLTSSLIVNADVDPNAAIADTKLATISTPGKVLDSATTATPNNSPSTIVERDPSGFFAATTISANFTGNLTGNVTGNVVGNLTGNVTGAASLNVLKAGDTMTGALILPAGTGTTPSIVPSLKFTGSNSGTGLSAVTSDVLSLDIAGTEIMNIASAGVTIDSFSGAAGVVHNSASGLLTSSLIVNADISNSAAIADTKLATISTAGKVLNSATTATNSNVNNAIVARDGAGNFSAGTITANLTGNVTGNLTGNATTATTATNFSGSLSGDVTGTQTATVVSTVGGQSASAVASATIAANTATSTNTPSTIVKRDASGNFSAGTITANLIGNVTGNASTATTANFATTAGTAANFSGSLSGDVTGTQSATVVSLVGGKTASDVANATTEVDAATSLDIPNTLVLRDSTGNFAANAITLDGAIISPTQATTKQYVDTAVSLGLTVHTPALVYGSSNFSGTNPPSGLGTIDGVSLVAGNRVLLNGQTNPVYNGIWVAEPGTWQYPTDFQSGTQAGKAYVLITSGNTYQGSSWVCSTPNSFIGTDSINFVEFALPNNVTGANVGVGTGQIYQGNNGQILDFRTLLNSTYITNTTGTNEVTISANASSGNIANQLVARDGAGNTSVGTLTATTGLNVTSGGASINGNVNLLLGSALRLQDTNPTGNFVAIQAPTPVPTSYTFSLPATAATAGQYLQATSPSATQWTTVGGIPTTAETYYVSKAGNDSSDGSFGAPFLTIKQALIAANAHASLSNPIVINVGAGVFVEDNSGGPLTIMTDGISIVGNSMTSTSIEPLTLSTNLFSCTVSNFGLYNCTLSASNGVSTATGFDFNSNPAGTFRISSVFFVQFQTAFAANSTGLINLVLDNLQFKGNTTSMSITNSRVLLKNSSFLGPISGSIPANTGITVTGSSSLLTILSNNFRLQGTALSATGSTVARIVGSNIESCTNGIVCSGGSDIAITGCTFINNNSNSVNINASGANTNISVEGCQFECTNTTTAISVTNGAEISMDSCAIENANIGLQCGTNGDTNTTFLNASGTVLESCITDIIQNGSSTFQFFGGIFDPDKTTINDPTNISIAAFDDNAEFTVGTNADVEHVVYNILNGQTDEPDLRYEPNYYGNKGTLYLNNNPNSTFTGVQATSNSAYNYIVTGDRSKEAGINLISDTGIIGNTDNVRGWAITKTGSSAFLNFNYANNDTGDGQAAIGSNTVMQLDGTNNQVNFPTATTSPLPTNTTAKLVWAGDTNLYRGGTNILQTDSNVVITNLTANRAVATNASDQLISSVTTTTELGFVSGVTSPIQTQLNNKVNKTGDTMTGALVMATQNAVRFQDSSASLNFVGINAPTAAASSYTLSLPPTPPAPLQVMRANSITPTNLEWITPSGSVVPATSRTIYVTTYGNDVTGNGTFTTPYASLSKAVSVANTLSSASNPIVINVSAGIYNENNNTGPISITADGISIVGEDVSAVIFRPTSAAHDLISSTATITGSNFTCDANGLATPTGISFGGVGNQSILTNVRIANFTTGVLCGGTTPFGAYNLNFCVLDSNGTGINVDNTTVACNNCNVVGDTTGLNVTGASATVNFNGGFCILATTAFNMSNNAQLIASGSIFTLDTNTVVQTSGARSVLQACTFQPGDGSPIIDVQCSGSGTTATLADCVFDGSNLTTTAATAVQVSNSATVTMTGGEINKYTNALVVGAPGDTSSTQLSASSVSIINCTNDIIQQGSSTLAFIGGSANGDLFTINDPTNATLSYFDQSENNALNIGHFADIATTLIHVETGTSDDPELVYKPSIYTAQAIGFENQNTMPTTLLTLSNSSSNFTAITTDRTKPAALRLVSDEGGTVGTTSALRGWDIVKNGDTNAELAFNFQNTDSFALSPIAQYTIMQLDGVNNQIQIPNSGTKIVFDGDTNLYRGTANCLRTDGNLAVGGLTANRAVATNASSQLVSSITTATELSFLNGVTSNVQTQLDGKVSKSGDTMTGTLQLPAGTTANPSLIFTGSTTTGLSANTSNLSLSTSGLQRMQINSAGTVSINNLTPAGVVHNDNAGNLSTSLIVNADVDPNAAIVDTKLATIATAGKVANSATTATSANTPNTIVLRDGAGNFNAGTITASLTGAASLNVLKAGDTMTGNLNMALQNAVNFQDGTGSGRFVGINGPSVVSANYTVSLPVSAPLANQFLQASASSPLLLQWADVGGNPTFTKAYYVAQNGNDSNDGSISAPFLTVAHAVSIANGVASLANPVAIFVNPGIFTETALPITISSDKIAIIGASQTGTVIQPSSGSSSNLFNVTSSNTEFIFLTLNGNSSTGTGVNITSTGPGTSGFTSVAIKGFVTAFSVNNTTGIPTTIFTDLIAAANGTALAITNSQVVVQNSIFVGGASPVNTGITITGSKALVSILSNNFSLLNNGVTIGTSSNVRMLGSNLGQMNNSVVCSGGCNATINGCTFLVNNSSSINVAASGANTNVTVNACHFNCEDASNNPQGIALQVTTGATLLPDNSTINQAVLAIQSGTTGDTSSTVMRANAVALTNNTHDIQQNGTSTMHFVGGIFDFSKTVIANPTNVSFAAFNSSTNDTLALGMNSNVSQPLFWILNGQATPPNFQYQPNYYGNTGTVLVNPNNNPTFSGIQSNSNDAYHYVVTGSNSNIAGISLISDTANFGASDNVRGWTINKLGTTNAPLAFNFSNNDTGLAAIGSYTLMQLDGAASQVSINASVNSTVPALSVTACATGSGAGASITSNSNAPALLLTGNNSTTAPALRMAGVPNASTSDRLLTIDSSGNVTKTNVTNGSFIFNGGQAGPLTIGTTNATSLAFITNNAPALSFTSGGAATLSNGLTITSGGETITSGTLTVSAGGAAITGTTSINTSGSSNTSIGNASSTTAITGPTNINISGSAATQIGTGGTGSVSIGNSTGNTTISGAVTINPGANQVGLSITGNGNAAAASLIASTTSPALILAGQGTASAPALRMTGIPAAASGNFLLAIDTTTGNVTQTPVTDGTITNAILNGGQPGPLTVGTTNATSLNLETNGVPALSINNLGAVTISPSAGTGLTITSGGETITSGGLTVSAGGAAITGTTSINTSGTATTSIGNSAGPSTNTIAGTTTINTAGSASTSLGNASSTTSITGPTNINTTGSSSLTQIGTGGTGAVSIGNTTGNTTVTGNLTINPGTGQTGLNVSTPGGTATAVNIDTSAASGTAARMVGNASSPTLVLLGGGTLTAPALRMSGVPTAASSNFVLAIDGSGNVTQTTTTTGNIIFNGGQPGPLTIGTTNSTSLAFITNNAPALSFTSGGAATLSNGLTITSGGASITGTTSVTGTTSLNTTGSATTNIGNSAGPSTNTILGTTTINTTGTSTTNIGNASSSTTLTGPVAINTTGAGSTQIGTGGTGSVNIGNIIGLTGISGAVTITPGANQVGLSITGNGNGAAASLTASNSSPALLLTGQSSVAAPALRMLGVPTAATTDQVLTIDTSGNVRATSSGLSSLFILNGGQAGPLTVGTTNATSLAFETNNASALAIDSSGNVTVGVGNGPITVNIANGTGGNTVAIGTGANTSAQTVNIASGAAAANSTVNILTGVATAGTQTVNIGTGASAKAINIGNTTGATGIVEQVGTGNFSLDGAASSTFSFAPSITTGTITMGGTAQSGTTTLGSSSATNTFNIANGTGATTVNIANNQTGGAVNIGGAMTTGNINLGSASSTTGVISTLAALVLKDVHAISGTAAVQTSGATSGTITTNATTAILILTGNPGANFNLTITFPPSPIDGQFFTIMRSATGNNAVLTLQGGTGAATIIPTGTFTLNTAAPNATAGGLSITYYYNSASNQWIRVFRG